MATVDDLLQIDLYLDYIANVPTRRKREKNPVSIALQPRKGTFSETRFDQKTLSTLLFLSTTVFRSKINVHLSIVEFPIDKIVTTSSTPPTGARRRKLKLAKKIIEPFLTPTKAH